MTEGDRACKHISREISVAPAELNYPVCGGVSLAWTNRDHWPLAGAPHPQHGLHAKNADLWDFLSEVT
jgi:hypothetical protein